MTDSPIKREVIIGDCSVTGCNTASYCKGYCDKHYRRFKSYGDPLVGKTFKGQPIRFLVSLPKTDDCIEWPYHVSESGYGHVRYKGKNIHAHRASLLIHVGEPSSGKMHAAHQPLFCHNRKCVNPRHLRWASVSENMQDRIIDGTQHRPLGELAGAAKLTAADVEKIRSSGEPQKQLAEKFGVTKSQISRIIRRERWCHV